MIKAAADSYHFRLGRASYVHTMLTGWLLFVAFVATAVLSSWLSTKLWPTYAHTFAPYLKWQDMLVALCWYIALLGVGGCVLALRFFYAVRTGYRWGMLTLAGNTTLIVRDLSHENLASMLWFISTALSCFVAALCGLLPEMLLGWTLHLTQPFLAVIATGLAIIFSLAGLAITLPALSFIVIGAVGSVSYCRKMGSEHAYSLTSQATFSIDGFVLTIMYPEAPEAMLDLNMLNPDDQRHLLQLLRERFVDAHRLNPHLQAEIEVALLETEQAAIPV